MSSVPKHEHKPSRATRLARHAKQAARASDRVLGILAEDIGEVTTWARGQARSVRESLSALGKTVEQTVTRRVSADAAEAPRPSSQASDVHDEVLPASSPLCALDLRSASNLDLLSAAHHDGKTSLDDEAAPPNYSPGVLPVLEALERVVSEHAKSNPSSLERDFRFWKLIELLQALKRAQQAPLSDSTSSRVQE
jgi:ubiquitin